MKLLDQLGLQYLIEKFKERFDLKQDKLTAGDNITIDNNVINAKFTDTVYTHPSTHPASMIVESETKRFVSDSEKLTWNSKSDTDTVTTVNGKTGAISKADIVALGIPASDTNTTYGVATTTVNGLMSSTDKVKMNGIETGANKYVHPSGTNPHGTVKSDIGLSDVENYGIATQAEAEAGTSNTRYTTPLRVKQAINNHNTDVAAHNDIRESINDLDADVVAHKAEKASQDNVHGLRGNNVALGLNSIADNVGHIAIGEGAESTSRQMSNVAIGKNAKTDSFLGRSVVIGENATAGASSVSVGFDSFVQKGNGIAIGRGARVEGAATSAYSIAIGEGSLTATANCLAIGRNSQAAGQYTTAIGAYVVAENLNDYKIGRNDSEVQIPGNFTVNGTKNFEIPHPKPEKSATHRIRHGAVESPTAGDTLYRYTIQSTQNSDKVFIDLPDYFIYLNKNVQIFVTPQGHFGNGYGILNEETEQLEIHCQNEGDYNVLVIGTRNDDHQSVKDWDIKGVEREIGESWTGETYTFSVDEIIEVEEIKEESV